jgi:flagellar biosynthesis/type III secretory pathway protein FliH
LECAQSHRQPNRINARLRTKLQQMVLQAARQLVLQAVQQLVLQAVQQLVLKAVQQICGAGWQPAADWQSACP